MGETSKTYCIVPRELARKLHDPLRRFFADRDIEVVVERRGTERRGRFERRVDAGSPPPSGERRVIRNEGGRRVCERRGAIVPVAPPELPRKAQRYADRLTFIERVAPPDQHSEDIDTARLVTRIQGGDSELFADLYLRYFDRVYSYFRVALRDQYEAEDLTQQVFVKVLERLPSYERRSQPFRAWLFAIAKNFAVDFLRSQRHVLTEDPGALDRREPASTSERQIRALQWLSDGEVLMFVERLPVIQRQALMLRYLLGFTTAEIAQLLDRSPDTVRQMQSRALAYLEERLVAIGREPMRKKVRETMFRARRPSPQSVTAYRPRLAA